ncbi:C-terminal helicase domain-containing protein, partial [Pseudomonadota bacterium]
SPYCATSCFKIISRRVVDALKEQGLSTSDIGVIATYASQVDSLRNGIGRILRGTPEGREVLKELFPNVDSVDGFQGDQRNYVFMSFTRSNTKGDVGFTDEESRINVGISRAADHLVIVGDTSTLIDRNQDPVSRARFAILKQLVAQYGEVREIKFESRRRKRDRDPAKRRARRKKAKARDAARGYKYKFER